MTQLRIYKEFEKLFPLLSEELPTFKRNGTKSIILNFKGKGKLIFVFYDVKTWRLETYPSNGEG